MGFAAIYVPDFPVEAIVRTAPELRAQAVAVVEGTPPLLVVAGANGPARECGVEPGMTALQAEERLNCVAAAHIRRRSAAQEQAAHAALLDCAHAFSPHVEDTALDTLLLDAAGLERLFGPAATMARELARRVAEVGLEANIAVAANPDAAMHAARGFPGVTVIAPGEEAARLGGLPIDVLCGADSLSDRGTGGDCATALEMIETLDRWGVRNLRALAVLPEVAVAQRLGQEGVRWQQLARGEGLRPLHVAEPQLTFEEAVELEYPVALLEPLAFLLNRMLEQLCARLAARALAAQELRLKLELDPGGDPEKDVSSFAFQVSRGSQQRETRNTKRETTFARAIKLPVPMLDAKVFLKLLQLDLQSHPPGAPVVKVWLAAEPAEPRRTQSGLFVPVTPEPEKLELTLARIKGAISRQPSAFRSNCAGGDLPVGSPEVLDTHRPDAFRMKKFNPYAVKPQSPSTRAPSALGADDNLDSDAVQSSIGNQQSSLALLAMRVFRPPLAVTVVLHEGRPIKLRTDNDRITSDKSAIGNRQSAILEVVWAAGPWRSSGEWWEEQAWSREEWDVALKADGDVALYRIYRDDGGAWFVEAEYD